MPYPNLHYTANFRAMPMNPGAFPGWGMGMDMYPYVMDPAAYQNGKPWTQRGIETIQDSSNVALVWDGSQVQNGRWMGTRDWTAEALNIEGCGGMSNNADNNNPYGVYDPNMPPNPYVPQDVGQLHFDYTAPIPMGENYNSYWNYQATPSAPHQNVYQNVDPADGYYLTPGVLTGWTNDLGVTNIRYRHGQNDTVNVLFADGHVAPLRLDESQYRYWCMNYR
jgi:prepilin-type processing-associated H-X9-DG protein